MSEPKEWKLLSNVAKTMLNELIERHEEYNKFERARFLWGLFALFCLGCLLMYSYDLFFWQHGTIKGNILHFATSKPLFWLLIIILTIALVHVQHFMKKATKAEDEFEALRKEVIERNQELWEHDHSWAERDAIYEYMKKEHDINLYFH